MQCLKGLNPNGRRINCNYYVKFKVIQQISENTTFVILNYQLATTGHPKFPKSLLDNATKTWHNNPENLFAFFLKNKHKWN
jgi:hypothetical protein